MIEGVTIIGDVLRPDGKGRPGGVDRATIWMFDAIKRQVKLACRLPIDVITAGGDEALSHWLRTSRPPAAAHTYWAACFDDPSRCAGLETILAARLNRRFCVGYELPPYLRTILNLLNVPHIDLRVHPIRFLDDLLFAARASEGATRDALLAISLAEAEVIVLAGLREAMCHMISEARVPAGTLVVVGQRPLDCTQIVNGAFFDAMPLLPEIHAICARHPAILLKPHPLEPQHSLLEIAASEPNVAGVVNDNLYRLLSLPQISAILTVNSSVAHEAQYFGKRVHALAPLPIKPGWRGDCDSSDVYASLDDQVLSVDFWRLVLAPHMPVTKIDGVRLPPKPNRLRIALDSFWNFQEIDTDRVPARPSL